MPSSSKRTTQYNARIAASVKERLGVPVDKLMPESLTPPTFSKHLNEALNKLTTIESDPEVIKRLLTQEVHRRISAHTAASTGDTEGVGKRGGARSNYLCACDVQAVIASMISSQSTQHHGKDSSVSASSSPPPLPTIYAKSQQSVSGEAMIAKNSTDNAPSSPGSTKSQRIQDNSSHRTPVAQRTSTPRTTRHHIGKPPSPATCMAVSEAPKPELRHPEPPSLHPELNGFQTETHHLQVQTTHGGQEFGRDNSPDPNTVPETPSPSAGAAHRTPPTVVTPLQHINGAAASPNLGTSTPRMPSKFNAYGGIAALRLPTIFDMAANRENTPVHSHNIANSAASTESSRGNRKHMIVTTNGGSKKRKSYAADDNMSILVDIQDRYHTETQDLWREITHLTTDIAFHQEKVTRAKNRVADMAQKAVERDDQAAVIVAKIESGRKTVDNVKRIYDDQHVKDSEAPLVQFLKNSKSTAEEAVRAAEAELAEMRDSWKADDDELATARQVLSTARAKVEVDTRKKRRLEMRSLKRRKTEELAARLVQLEDELAQAADGSEDGSDKEAND